MIIRTGLTASQVLATLSVLELKRLVQANKRLHTAYLLKDTFDQLWDYSRAGWAPRVFANWKDALKWQHQERFRPGLAGRHSSPAPQAGGRTLAIPFTLAYCALVTSTEAGFPKGDLGWRSSV